MGATTTGPDATPPQLSVKTWGGGGVGGGSSRGSGGGPAGGRGGVRVRVRGRGRVRARVRARVAVRACSPPVALLQVKICPCCFNTNMHSLQNFEYFEYRINT